MEFSHFWYLFIVVFGVMPIIENICRRFMSPTVNDWIDAIGDVLILVLWFAGTLYIFGHFFRDWRAIIQNEKGEIVLYLTVAPVPAQNVNSSSNHHFA